MGAERFRRRIFMTVWRIRFVIDAFLETWVEPFRHRGTCLALKVTYKVKVLLASHLDSVLCLSPPSALHNFITT